ncbi:MAG: hypothetical protein MPJ25_00420 [Pirellulales bacterium]|nr:hypothetical protein [Pirellulales bacterium]
MIEIHNVYQTVLNILNKENRGYVTPSEFNTLAKQAQTEVFESYFTAQYRSQQAPMSDGDYSDIMRNYEEKITFFDNVETITRNGFQNPEGDITNGYYQYPSNFYRLGVVTVDGRIADEVSHKDIPYINLSPLTAPTKKQPVYTRHEQGLIVHPINDINEIKIVYVRVPATPQWLGVSMRGQLIPDRQQTGYQDFELHPSEEPELVAKILAYSGVLVRQPDVVQAASAKEQQINQTKQ